MRILVLLLFLLFSISCAFSVILEVPNDYDTIQEAIDYSIDGDTILVQQGEYFENINFSGKNITVTSNYLFSQDPEDISSTLINGNSVDTVVRFINNEGSAARIIGFSIVNGSGIMGGGIFCSNASPTISYNVIRDNTANFGGGIMINNSTPMLQNNTIVQNSGFGLHLANSSVESSGCIIYFNQPDQYNISNSNLYMTFSDIEDVFVGEGNISEDPLFLDPSSDDFSLPIGSPCINSGDPFIGADPDGTRSDMGALFTANDESSLYADFVASELLGEIPFTVNFNNNSQAFNTEIIDYLWQFGENDFSSAENPSFTFTTPGVYDISLSIEDEHGNSSVMFKEDYILAAAPVYNGPIWYVSGEGSDLSGNGSVAYPFATIQYTIDTVNENDIIVVEIGNYQENLTISNKNIILTSRYYYTNDETYIASTIIDANFNESAISFYGSIDTTCIVNGFTLINGYSGSGGGIYCDNAGPKLSHLIIENCEVDNNGPYSRGGGIFGNASDMIIENSIIRNNTCQSATYLQGGGMYINNSNLIIRNSDFFNNTSQYGGGIYLHNSDAVIINTMIRENEADINAAGVGVNVSNAELINCVIAGNIAMEFGGAICGWDYADIILTNCTLTENTGVLNGGGLFLNNGVTGIINNSIFWENIPEQIYYHPSNSPNQVEVNYSCFTNGENGITTSGNGLVNWQEGNIEDDPLFLNSEEHPYQINIASPCIDTGTPEPDYLDLPQFDLLGNFRIWDGNEDGTSRVDIGAYEFSAPSFQNLNISPLVLEFYNYEDCTDGLSFTIVNPNPYEITINNITQNGLFNEGLAEWHISNFTINLPHIIAPDEALELTVEIGLPVEELRDILIDYIYIATEYGQQEVRLLLDGNLITSFGENTIQVETQLNGNIPNPFNPSTLICYQLAEESHVAIEIYNIKGQIIKYLVNTNNQAGTYEATWDGRDLNNRMVSSGIYFYLMKADEYLEIKKMVLMK
jgi:hypothetical protein